MQSNTVIVNKDELIKQLMISYNNIMKLQKETNIQFNEQYFKSKLFYDLVELSNCIKNNYII